MDQTYTKHHFIRESLKNGQIDVSYVSTEKMGADLLTKALPSVKHYKKNENTGY